MTREMKDGRGLARMGDRAVKDGPLARMGRAAKPTTAAGEPGRAYAKTWKPGEPGESVLGWVVEIRTNIQPKNPGWQPFDVLVLPDEDQGLRSVLATTVLRPLIDDPPPLHSFLRVVYDGYGMSRSGDQFRRFSTF